MANGTRNGKIDFLKFLFAVVIVLHHGVKNITDIKEGWLIGGSLAVEFFFMVSGYLLMAGIHRMAEPTMPLGVETGKFLLRKLKGFYPDVAIAFLMGFGLELHTGGLPARTLFARSFSELFLLHSTGLGVVQINAQLWYISSMLLWMAILYPLLRKYPHMMTRVVLPLTAVLVMGYFCGNKQNPRNPLGWIGITYKGNLRAVADLGIGVCLFPLAQRLKEVKFSAISRVLLSVVEWACYLLVLRFMWEEKASRHDYYYIFLFAVAVFLSFSAQGIDANWFRGRVVAFLGRFSFPLYLSHYCWSAMLNKLLPEGFTVQERMEIYLVVSVVSAALIMVLSHLLRKLGKQLKKPAQKLFLAEEK